jgi:hypothetical protein
MWGHGDPQSKTGILKDARLRLRACSYGQVSGDVTATVATVTPSVTFTFVVCVPVPGPAGPRRLIVTVLPAVAAVTNGDAELAK